MTRDHGQPPREALEISGLGGTCALPKNWFTYLIADGADPSRPGLYEWRLEDGRCYIGKYKRIRRPTKEYSRNVERLLGGKDYRKGNPQGFRRVHRELALALRSGRNVTLTILENPPLLDLDRRERELIRERGTLNDQ